ncbi:MAG: transglycosylase SLT domain-containing protein [Candidatus Melainabacteria bacterium]
MLNVQQAQASLPAEWSAFGSAAPAGDLFVAQDLLGMFASPPLMPGMPTDPTAALYEMSQQISAGIGSLMGAINMLSGGGVPSAAGGMSALAGGGSGGGILDQILALSAQIPKDESTSNDKPDSAQDDGTDDQLAAPDVTATGGDAHQFDGRLTAEHWEDWIFNGFKEANSRMPAEKQLGSDEEIHQQVKTFINEVQAMATRLGGDPDFILAVMGFESAGFIYNVSNPDSGATGLIQFMDSSAESSGTTTEALSTMDPISQLPFVEKYFENNGAKGKINSLAATYSVVFAPAYLDDVASNPTVAFYTQADGAAYTQNSGGDVNGDGTIDASEMASKARIYLDRAIDPSVAA